MATSLYLVKNYEWTDLVSALLIAIGAVITFFLILFDDDAGSSFAVLLIFGMEIIVVAVSGPDGSLMSPLQRCRVPGAK
jgi:hypothetical protein